MQYILDQIRYYDFHTYLYLHGAVVGRPWLNTFYLFFARYGIVIILFSFVYLILQRRILAFVCSFISLALAASFALIITLFWRRPRPFVSHSATVVTPALHGLWVNSISFPSAHTYFAFTIATSVYLYGHRRLGFFLYVVAILVALGRIGAGLHYPSDTIAGALIGVASGLIGYRIVESSQSKWE